MTDTHDSAVTAGEGYSISSLDSLGDGYGFRKIRVPLGLEAFGANALVLPPGIAAGEGHYHDIQDELYVVLAGKLEIEFDDGTRHLLQPGGLAHVAAKTIRRLHTPQDAGDTTVLVVGGKDGYVPRDAHQATPNSG